MKTMTTEEAVAWVDQNVRQIQGHTRKYLSYAPYDQEDFLQDAYEAAIVAAKVSAEREIPFPPCFWITFKGKISAVTPNPDSARHAGSASPPSTKCNYVDFFDTLSSSAKPEFNIDIDRVFWIIQKHLTLADRKLLGMALGIREGTKPIREIARDLGCSPANVRQKLNRIYNHLSKLVEKGQLQIRLNDDEPATQVTLPGIHKNGSRKRQGRLVKAA